MPAKPPVSAAADIRSIEVFRPGTFTPMQGAAVTMSADDLRRLASAYDLDGAPAPVVVGHPRTDAPAFGWAHSFAFDEGSQRLVARVGDLEPEFEQAVKDKRYRKISLSLFPPDAPNNPKPGFWYPKHIGFLGGAAPAVTGLAPVQLAGGEAVTFEFGDPAFSSVAQMFRRFREWLIEKEGVETADRVAPDWDITWIDRASEDNDDGRLFAARPAPTPKPETSMSNPDAAKTAATPSVAEAAFAEREARLAEREAQVAQRAAEAHHAAHLSFAEALVAEGRLIPAQRDRAVAILDAAAGLDRAEVSFAEGERTIKAGLAEAIRDLLKAQPKAVSYGRHPAPAMDGAAVEFAAPAGAEVSSAGLETLAKAHAWRKQNPQASFLDAVRAVTA